MTLKQKTKPAFPGKEKAMGYQPGLTKLEYVMTHLASAFYAINNATIDEGEIEHLLSTAKRLLDAAEWDKAE